MQAGRLGSSRTKSRSARGCPPTSTRRSFSTHRPESSGRALISAWARAPCPSTRARSAPPRAHSAANERYENARHRATPFELARARFFAQQQGLAMGVANRNRDPPSRRELIRKCVRNLAGRGRDQNSIIRRLRRKPEAAVAQADVHVARAAAREVLFGERRERRQNLDRVHLPNQAPQ